ILLAIGLVGTFSVLSTLVLEYFWMRQGISFKDLKNMHKVENKNFLVYNFLRIDGSFTLFFILILFSLHAIAIIFFSTLYFLILIKKIYTMTQWRKKKK